MVLGQGVEIQGLGKSPWTGSPRSVLSPGLYQCTPGISATPSINSSYVFKDATSTTLLTAAIPREEPGRSVSWHPVMWDPIVGNNDRKGQRIRNKGQRDILSLTGAASEVTVRKWTNHRWCVPEKWIKNNV